MKYLAGLIFISLSFTGRCDFANYFEIKLNQKSVYHSGQSADQKLMLERDSLKEEDLIEINYFQCGGSPIGDFELHIQVANTSTDLTFINNEPKFTLNMGWLTQFANKAVTIYFHEIKTYKGQENRSVVKVADLFIS
ncbi:MAG: hypothetical protein HYZ14_10195 [Bacteroidetes bacterium]|nr:hypothetical protein [Bacteroidota bacterium]